MGAVGVLVVVVLGICLYMLPSIVALSRTIPNQWSVVVINLLLGWTLVGWVVALAMAARDTKPSGAVT